MTLIYQGDYFAVRVTEDPVFGTPVFTTMGGQSKCPGETGTSRRESNVKLVQVVDRCCGISKGKKSTGKSCVCTDLEERGDAVLDQAAFGVVIHNLSPSGNMIVCISVSRVLLLCMN